MKSLTPKQTAFANEVAAGKDLSESYRLAYDCTKGSPMTVGTNASRTAALPHVAAYIATLKAQQEKRRFLTRERKRELLAAFAEDAPKHSDRIKAIEVENRMVGDDAPQQVQVFGLSELLGLVRKKS